jgi:hypothetical protein
MPKSKKYTAEEMVIRIKESQRKYESSGKRPYIDQRQYKLKYYYNQKRKILLAEMPFFNEIDF